MALLPDSHTPKFAQPIGLLLCFIALVAISFSIGLRLEPSLMQKELQEIFHLTPDALGELIVRYQYSLIVTLLFAGVVVDYVGPRTILILAILVALVGNYLFATATTIPGMLHGRILIGYAHPFILISALKLGTLWLPRRQFSLFVGLLFATLLMTPTILKPTLVSLAQHTNLLTYTNFFDIVGITLVILLVIVRKKQSHFHLHENINRKDILAIFTNKTIWSLCLISCFGWIANTFLLNYGMIFLLKTFNFTHASADDTINIAFTCFATGAILLSFLAELKEKMRFLMAIGYIFAAITLSIVFFIPHLGATVTSYLLFATGFFAGSAVICYSKAYEFCTAKNVGTAFALIAFITTLGNTVFTLEVGNMLENIMPNLSTTNSFTWQIILGFIPSALAIGAILALRLHKNKTHLTA